MHRSSRASEVDRWVAPTGLGLAALLLVVVSGIVYVLTSGREAAAGLREEAEESIRLAEMETALHAMAVTTAELVGEAKGLVNNTAAHENEHRLDRNDELAHPGIDSHLELMGRITAFRSASTALRILYRDKQQEWLDLLDTEFGRYVAAIEELHDREHDPAATDDEYHSVVVPFEQKLSDLLVNERNEEAEHIATSIALARRAERASRIAVPSLSVVALLIVGGLLWLINERRRRQIDSLRRLSDEKDRFIATVSHELRTPLTAVVGFLDMLSAEDTDPADRNELLLIAAREAGELTNLVEDLLATAQAEAGTIRLSAVAVDPIAQSAQVLETLGHEDVARVRVIGRAPSVVADPARVRQILRNLLTNAFRYGGSEITIQFGETTNGVSVAVLDNGPGVDESATDRIFMPYERAHTERGTTESVGLGLAVSRSLARLMGGDLEYRREKQQTAFVLTLPAVVRDRPAAATAGEATT